MQLIHAIPLIWKQKINNRENNIEKNDVIKEKIGENSRNSGDIIFY